LKVLFLGYAVDENIANSLTGVSVAGNKMQLCILKNLARYEDIDLDVITIYPVAAFPHDNNIFIKKDVINLYNNIKAIKAAFLNVPILKQLWQTMSVYCEAKRIVKEDKNTIVFSFNLFPQIGLPLVWLKKKYHCNTIALLADLPIDDKTDRRGISKIFRDLFDRLTRKSISECDHLIVLNKHAVERYVPGKDHIVVEGGIDIEEYSKISGDYGSYERSQKNIVYSGALTEYSGIMSLIEAMKYVRDSSVQLHIYGSGYLQTSVEKAVKYNANIQFFGRVSNQEIKCIQKNAWLLVNPRLIDDPISCVTFPSKIFEYMLSETPILTTRLNGFTDEYSDKMYFVESNNPRVIASKINELTNIAPDNLTEMGNRAHQFVTTEKTWEIQCRKIYRYLSAIKGEIYE
jgi:glycosyltransferase involved in cell wall biosynthesis